VATNKAGAGVKPILGHLRKRMCRGFYGGRVILHLTHSTELSEKPRLDSNTSIIILYQVAIAFNDMMLLALFSTFKDSVCFLNCGSKGSYFHVIGAVMLDSI
jgi:hypothetical protein